MEMSMGSSTMAMTMSATSTAMAAGQTGGMDHGGMDHGGMGMGMGGGGGRQCKIDVYKPLSLTHLEAYLGG